MAYLAHAETAAVWCVHVTTKQLYHLISLHAVQRQVDNSTLGFMSGIQIRSFIHSFILSKLYLIFLRASRFNRYRPRELKIRSFLYRHNPFKRYLNAGVLHRLRKCTT